jgi:ParB family chromosome partitioning protein
LRKRFEQKQPHLSEGELDALVGQSISLSARTVRRYISLLELSPVVQQYLQQGDLTVTQAQHLLRIPNVETREEVAREAAEEGFTAAQISRLASFFAANPNLTIDSAVRALEEGVRLRQEVPPEPVEGPLGRLVRVPPGEDREERVWEEAEEEALPPEPEMGDWARLRRFGSLDEVVDEGGRIMRALYEGDLERWAGHDAQAPVKVRLLLRHLRAVVEGLERLFQARGWEEE